MKTDCSISIEEIASELNKDFKKPSRKLDKVLDDLTFPMVKVSIEEFRKMYPNVGDAIPRTPVELCTCGCPTSGETVLYIYDGVSTWEACQCKTKE